MMIAPSIRQEILSMDDEDRAEIIGLLLESMDGADPNDANLDSVSEAILRSEELDSGVVQALSQEEFWRSIRAGRGK